MPPRAVSYLFEGVGVGFPIKFPHSFQKNSNQIPLVPYNNPSKSFCSCQVPRMFPSILLVPFNNSSIFFCSHQVPKKFPSNSYCSHQYSFVLIRFPKILLFPWVWRIGRWARRWTVRLVRDSGKVLNGVPQLVGRPEGEPHGRQTSAAYGRAESPDFQPARFCGGSASRGAVCRAASFMWATHL